MAAIALNGEFLFHPPDRLDSETDLTHAALRLAAISGRLALEDRTVVRHKDGRAENVAEHSFMLSVVAPAIAEEFFPELDANLVARFATIHDMVEAYVGDTPTHRYDAAELKRKVKREKLGLEQLLEDYEGLGSFTRLISDYEVQVIPEARFVRVMDKLMPLLVHFVEGGETLSSNFDIPELLANSALKARLLREQYPEFGTLIDAREELAVLASKHLY